MATSPKKRDVVQKESSCMHQARCLVSPLISPSGLSSSVPAGGHDCTTDLAQEPTPSPLCLRHNTTFLPCLIELSLRRRPS
jgi:hypothetical protein